MPSSESIRQVGEKAKSAHLTSPLYCRPTRLAWIPGSPTRLGNSQSKNSVDAVHQLLARFNQRNIRTSGSSRRGHRDEILKYIQSNSAPVTPVELARPHIFPTGKSPKTDPALSASLLSSLSRRSPTTAQPGLHDTTPILRDVRPRSMLSMRTPVPPLLATATVPGTAVVSGLGGTTKPRKMASPVTLDPLSSTSPAVVGGTRALRTTPLPPTKVSRPLAVVQTSVAAPVSLGKPADDLKAALAGLQSDEWTRQSDGLNLVRRVMEHSPQPLVDSPDLVALVDSICSAVGSLRSRIAKTALEALTEVFSAIEAVEANPPLVSSRKTVDTTLEVALHRACGTNAFLSGRAAECLAAVAKAAKPDIVVGSLLARARSKSAAYRYHVLRAMSLSLGRMAALAQYSAVDDLIQLLANLIADQSGRVREQARCCLLTAHIMLGPELKAMARRVLTPVQAHELGQALALALGAVDGV
ncbi:CLASP N terminal [Carpediemonas membranifera]|uniref:CLASP N terminal n=1 Tax=Carpediemonas membranifera TaxID=201153 RepID=A0A8J6B1C3_9EUKA|nr:CLASP N terminal [Carpediemonas membranifera]|eukprot:KAG9392179.1 CLASP N terminal [Carpediemonas membranifera]